MPSAKRPVLDGTMLRQRLAALRRRLRLVASVRGSGLLLTVLLATALVAGLLDWRWHLPDLVRAIVLVATLTGSILVSYRYLFRPLSAPSDDLSLALRVEEEYPALNDSLASTVQFLERGGQVESSSAILEREAIKRALGRAAGCDFAKVVNKRGLVWAGVSGGFFAALTAALIVLSPTLAATAFLRLAHPFGGIEWPKKTLLEIDEPRLRIGRNEAFEVRGTVRGVIPPQAVVVFRFEGFPNLDHHCDIQEDESGIGRLHTSLPAGRVERNFHFQVKANDAVSPEYAVEVLPPPSLVALDNKPSPQLQLFFPRYTGLPSPETLSPGMGNVDAVAGTAVRLRARVDRPLRRAWIEYQPEEPSVVVGDLLALFDGGRPWWEPVPAKLDDDRCTFTIHFTPTVHGMYVLHFEDETGLHNSRLFELRLHPDPAPAVHLERPSAQRDILSVLPTAELPLEVHVDDLQYAVRSVYLEYRTGREEQPRRLYLYDPAAGPAPLMAPWAGPAVLAAPPLAMKPQRLDFQQKLSLKSLQHPDGSSLKEDDVLLLRACADDYDDVNPNKEQGHSPEIEIHIVGRSALEIVLNQQQADIQQELLRLREKQRESLQKVTAAENRLKKGEKLKDNDQEKLLQAEKTQQEIRERIGDEKEGVRSEVKRTLDSLKQNNMEKTAAQERMKDVARELQRLADNELQQIEPRLTNARQLAEMQEEKSRAERQAALESRAKEAEKEARAAEKSAGDREREAKEAENKAKQSDNEADRASQLQEAKRQHQRAEELRQRERALRQEAERARREAKQPPDPAQPRKTLAEARKAQEEVEKTLNDLLTRRLEPWTSSHEIKGEANRLLEEQKRLQADVEKLQKEDMTGKPLEKLTAAEKAELDNLKDAQRKLEERTRQLLDKMNRVAQEREKKEDMQTAQELRDAWKDAQQDHIPQKMRDAREDIQQNRLNDAQGKQQDSIRDLKKLVKNLEDRREAELDRLAKKMREKEKELDDLVKEQEELRKKIQEAGKIGDKAQRAEELKRLARRQKELRDKTKQMVEQLTRMRASRAGEALSRAGEEMDGAGQQMDRGQQGEDEQEEALERLQEAQRELQRARQETEEELAREQIIRLADLIRPLKERQEALSAETGRFQESVQLKGEWTRSLRSDFLRKGEAQNGLGAETEEVAQKRLSKAPVFSRMMRRAGEAMTAAGERMKAVAKDAVDPKKLPDAETARLQQQAQRRLTQVVDALKEAAEKMEQARGQSGDEGGEGGDNAAKSSPPSDGIPPVAQLKLLRDLQKDINERTEAFKKQHPNTKELPKKERAVLESIRKDQQDVAELIDELNRPAEEAGDAQGEKK